MAAQERIVLPFLSDRGGTLKMRVSVKKQTSSNLMCIVAAMIHMPFIHLQNRNVGNK